MGKLASFFQKTLNFLVPSRKDPKFTSAIIVAGGSSSRMGDGISKQMLEIDGLPVIVHTLLAFENTPEISEIIIVAKADEIGKYKNFKSAYGITKLKRAVIGGDTRQRSVEKGFFAISDKSQYVAIHDGARCLITPEEISKVCNMAYIYDAATAAMRAIDTVKIATDNDFIEKTIDRNLVWHAQTPQIFKTELYNSAVAIAQRDGIQVTDDCALVENITHPIKLVECSSSNIKITTPDDISFAANALSERKNAANDNNDWI